MTINLNTTELLALSIVEGVGAISIYNLAKAGFSYNDLVAAPHDELLKCLKGEKAAAAVPRIKNEFDKYLEKAARILEEYRDQKIHVITYWDNKYPRSFKSLKKPPIFLYAKGNLDLLNMNKAVAVVGTRESSERGAQIARKTATFFAEQGFNIVSGLAKGIDTAGHLGALYANGKTTAILVDVKKIYPKENTELAKEIIQNNGLLLAENRPGGFVGRSSFVDRDRLQSVLSVGIFVIETDVKGGTMHTVKYAQEQKRAIYCPDLEKVHYPMGYEKIRGIRKLLSEGVAKPYTQENYPEILAHLLTIANTLVEQNKGIESEPGKTRAKSDNQLDMEFGNNDSEKGNSF